MRFKTAFPLGTTVNLTEEDQPNGPSRAFVIDRLEPGGLSGRSGADLVPGGAGTIGRLMKIEKSDGGLLLEVETPQGIHRAFAARGGANGSIPPM